MYHSDKKNKKNIPSWPNNHAPIKNNHYTTAKSESTEPSVHEESLDLVSTINLQKGELYIVKIKLIAIALFQGWDDDMCCFSILRTDLLDELKWSEARYLPENFDAYLAFDYAGNPPIHLWTKQLRAVIPINWFNIFEEARCMQRQWHLSFWDPQQQKHHYPEEERVAVLHNENDRISYDLADSPVAESSGTIDHYNQGIQEGEIEQKQRGEQYGDGNEYYNNQQEDTVIGGYDVTHIYYSAQSSQQQEEQSALINQAKNEFPSTPAMRLQNQYIVTQQQQQKDLVERQKQQQQTDRSHAIQDIIKAEEVENKSNKVLDAKKIPELNKRGSFSSLFLKKKKSKKSLHSNISEEDKRKNAPPTPIIHEKYHNNKQKSLNDNSANSQHHKVERKQVVSSLSEKIPVTPVLISSGSNTSSASSPTTTEVKTSKNDDIKSKFEVLDDMDSYFDMQATFSFLSNDNTTENLSFLNSK